MRVADGVEVLELQTVLPGGGPGGMHPTLVWDDSDAILIDAGLSGDTALQHECERSGVSVNRLSKVILTHHDLDHIGGVPSIVAAAARKIEVIAHAEEKPYIVGEIAPTKMIVLQRLLLTVPEQKRVEIQGMYETMKAAYACLDVSVDRTVGDQEEVLCCGGITVIHTPGHTPGHISLYLRGSKTLIAALKFVNGEGLGS